MNTISIKKLHPDAIIPTRSHETDAGLDIYANEDVILVPQAKHLLKTGIAVDIPPGYVGFLTSRSGVSSKTNIVVETGKIDAGYNGEMMVNIKNDEQANEREVEINNRELDRGFEMLKYDVKGQKVKNGNPFGIASGRVYQISKGDKIAQLVITPIVTPAVKMVDEFEGESARGNKGFGSTDEVYP